MAPFKEILFSIVETMGATAIILTLFRYKFTSYLLPAFAVNLAMALQSFALNDIKELTDYSPLINMVLLSAFICKIVRVPLLWSFVVSVSGYMVSIVVQAGLVALSGYPLSELQTDSSKIYAIQTATSMLLIVSSYFLYQRGIGLSFQFKKLSFKPEKAFVVSLIVGMAVAFCILLKYRAVYMDLMFLLPALFVFAYYLLKKESKWND
jgi:hypothetical protein